MTGRGRQFAARPGTRTLTYDLTVAAAWAIAAVRVPISPLLLRLAPNHVTTTARPGRMRDINAIAINAIAAPMLPSAP